MEDMTTTPPPPPTNPYAVVTPMSPSDEKLWATLVHIGGILFGFLPALIGYVVLKDRGPFIREHTATALNFQITAAIVAIVSIPLSFVIIGFFLLMAVAVLIVVFSILAAIAANNGQPYTYPLSIPFVH
jgi:uncharacterized Tic20 family protein